MRIKVWTVVLSFVVIGASLVAFEVPGIAVATVLLLLVAFRQWNPWWGVSLLAAIAVLLISIEPFLPTTGAPREVARRATCLHRLDALGDVMRAYHAEHGHFPPAYIADENGKPMHSWRVLLLPYLERQDLYEQYDFREPWNGPKNRRLAEMCPGSFRCPSDCSPESETSYVVVVGPQTIWPGEKRGPTDAMDRGEDTVMLIEAADSGIAWSEPRDLTFEEAVANMNAESGPAIRSRHSAAVHALFQDGCVRELVKDMPEATLRALLTANGGEALNGKDFQFQQVEERRPRAFQGREGAILVLVASFLLLWFSSKPKRESQSGEPAIDSPPSETSPGP